MKKTVAVLLAVLMLTCMLTACSSSSGGGSSSKKTSPIGKYHISTVNGKTVSEWIRDEYGNAELYSFLEELDVSEDELNRTYVRMELKDDETGRVRFLDNSYDESLEWEKDESGIIWIEFRWSEYECTFESGRLKLTDSYYGEIVFVKE